MTLVSADPTAAKTAAPDRRCIVTGEVRDRDDLVRFVVGPADNVVPDIAHELPGRGLWITASREAVDTALAKNRFAWAARRKVNVDRALADQVEALLARRCLELLGLSRRAGKVVVGFEKVRAALETALRGNQGVRLDFSRPNVPQPVLHIRFLVVWVAVETESAFSHAEFPGQRAGS